uniref:EF-hand domain-containing protein n=1 Tax=Hanusia phi TaxID=3032 RepID=A0A7S0HH16_9CRYP|mmetsp:Transcript_18222/g.41397  ORF Transcript_18222/g.41397 Transcript_18222/m.41397 type:complete len:776 (+) Transcript_18222:209-2536(+)
MSSESQHNSKALKKLFNAYCSKNEEGDKMIDWEALVCFLQDFKISPELLSPDEAQSALAETVKSDSNEIDYSEFKKLLRKLSIVEFKKKQYRNKYVAHDERFAALLAYMQIDRVDEMIARHRGSQHKTEKRDSKKISKGAASHSSSSSKKKTERHAEILFEEDMDDTTGERRGKYNDKKESGDLRRKETARKDPPPTRKLHQEEDALETSTAAPYSDDEVSSGWNPAGNSKEEEDLEKNSRPQPEEQREELSEDFDDADIIIQDEEGDELTHEGEDQFSAGEVAARQPDLDDKVAAGDSLSSRAATAGGEEEEEDVLILLRHASAEKRNLSRPQSAVRPPSATRHRPESAHRTGSSPSGNAVGGSGTGIAMAADTSSLLRQPRSKLQLRCNCRGKMGTLFLTTDMSWEQLCGHFRVLFGLEDDVPIVLTYRNGWDAENGGGRSVLCTSATDLALLYDSVAKHPPPQGILKVKLLMATDEENSSDERQVEEMQANSRDRDSELDKRVEYIPGGGDQGVRADHVTVDDSDAMAYRQAVRPPRPQSATSRPLSAPRSTRSGLDSCPQTQDFELSFNSASGMQIRPGNKQGSESHLENISEGSRMRSASRNPAGRRDALAEQSSMAPSVQSETSQLNSKAYEKLRSCVALGILPADAKLRLVVEHCTARRPSLTLRGSSEAYVKKFSMLKYRVKDKMSAWHVEVESNLKKSKIGSFEINLEWNCNGYPYEILIFSKLKTKRWPDVDSIVSSLCELLPKQEEVESDGSGAFLDLASRKCC